MGGRIARRGWPEATGWRNYRHHAAADDGIAPRRTSKVCFRAIAQRDEFPYIHVGEFSHQNFKYKEVQTSWTILQSASSLSITAFGDRKSTRLTSSHIPL